MLAYTNQPPNCRYSLMQNCWRTRAEERPNFSVVFAQLQNIHNKYAAIHDSQYGPTSQVLLLH